MSVIGVKHKLLIVFLASCFLTLGISEATFAETIAGTEYTISASLEGSIRATVQASGGSSTSSQDIMVSTTCPAGYSVLLSMDGDTNKLYRNADSGDIHYVSPASGTIDAPKDLGNNQWGFNINGGTKFSQIPVSATEVKTTTAAAQREKTTFTYGMKVSPELASGKYSGTVVYSVVPNPDCFNSYSEFEAAYVDAGKSTVEVAGAQYFTLQDMQSSICASIAKPDKTVTNPPEITLIDTRDMQLYTVRKLADGNCWMSQDLRITDKTLTPTDSDVATNYTLPSAQTAAFTNSSNNNQVGAISSNAAHGGGAYYSWYAATAGTGTSTLSGDATSSICPKNWQLPQNSGTKSFNNLLGTVYSVPNSAAGSTTLRSAPLSFSFAGYYNNTGFSGAGTYAYYWTATASSSQGAYYMYADTSYVYPQNNNYKYFGRSVRCVAR